MGRSSVHASVVVDELVRLGVGDAVLCPGSRNAPLAFALQAADAAGRLRLHVRIDERTAGFLALGLAKRSGRAVPVCTTSGTAVANLHPAVLEAAYSQVPLLVLSADRPLELVGTGANQTIVQPGIFADAPRLTIAAAGGGSPGQWRAEICRAVAATADGPVHVNIPFAEPLLPEAGDEVPAGRPGGAPWTVVPPARRAADPLPLDPAAPTLVVAGAGAPELGELPVPVIAEPGSAAWGRAVRTGPWLVDTLRPTQVVVAGRPTLHRGVQRLLADPAVAVHALGDGPVADVAGTVRAVGSLPELTPDAEWLRLWADADKAAAAVLDTALDTPGAPAGLRLARDLVAGAPPGSLLVLGSSNPIRDVALAAAPRPDLTLLANRGVAGIDGTVSTAVGAALAHDGPAYALLGDLTLLHDTTGLVIGPGEPRPDLTIVVLNDRGGGIFALLEQGAPQYAPAFERVFGTPHDVDLAALAAAMGVPHVVGELTPGAGLRLVEVPATRSDLRRAHSELRDAITAAIS